ncbi:peptidoglycan D,D-transpeptidase FtsI family protein [Paraburkholderia acidisoli]|uniref:Peptidoglycan D,D-transpeptidase FtsI n=1 Tax=Paraburkholderia acidisoli TaxID=2571748 RepID=A0A7Z2GPM5_9BURK|nr:penicillin-binding protein 2 [Paraburkholderia acidisoli]QGZ65642.1 penicillin-binding protein 2 [Paraburkholderia acidisoli]
MSKARKYLSFSRHDLSRHGFQRGRSRFAGFLFAGAFLALIARAAWVQCVEDDFYQHQGEIRQVSDIDLSASRGRITDRDGRPLALNLPTRTLWLDAQAPGSPASPSQIDALAHVLQIDPDLVTRAYASHRRFVYLSRQVDPDLAERAMRLDLPGVYASKGYRRFYPEAAVASNVVGFTGIDGRGQEGIERAANARLSGVDGWRRALHDARGNVIATLAQAAPRDGTDIGLSLDSPVQFAAYRALQNAVQRFDARSGSAIVLDAHTGEVLAMANWPSFDPNTRARTSGLAMRNRAVTDVFEPGSVMKPLTIALALQQGRVTPDSIVTTGHGRIRLDGATIHDDADFGTLTVAGVIEKSSNVGTTKIALMMPAQDMWQNFHRLGLGQAPRAGLPGEARGNVRPWKHWRRIEQATMGYGYGLSASLLQLAQAYTAFANDGVMVPATLHRLSAPPAGRRLYSARTAREVRMMMERVVSPDGTAPDAVVNGFTVAGKTGTAYRWTPHGYDRSHYRASFVGIIPAAHPRVIIAVSVDNPRKGSHFGGAVAGPAFVDIATQTMQLLSVQPDKPAINDTGATHAPKFPAT